MRQPVRCYNRFMREFKKRMNIYKPMRDAEIHLLNRCKTDQYPLSNNQLHSGKHVHYYFCGQESFASLEFL